MARILSLSLLLAAALAVVACEAEQAPEAAQEEEIDTSNLETVVVNVEGMTCGEGCPPAVRDQLMSVKGVKKVDVDYDSKTATCWVEKETAPATVAAGLSDRFTGTVAGS